MCCITEKLEERLATVQPKFVFTDKTRADNVISATQTITSVQEVFIIHGEHKKCTPLKDLLLDDGQGMICSFDAAFSAIIVMLFITECPENVPIDLNSMSWLVFSSGTTGTPKGVVHMYKSLLTAALAYR